MAPSPTPLRAAPAPRVFFLQARVVKNRSDFCSLYGSCKARIFTTTPAVFSSSVICPPLPLKRCPSALNTEFIAFLKFIGVADFALKYWNFIPEIYGRRAREIESPSRTPRKSLKYRMNIYALLLGAKKDPRVMYAATCNFNAEWMCSPRREPSNAVAGI